MCEEAACTRMGVAQTSHRHTPETGGDGPPGPGIEEHSSETESRSFSEALYERGKAIGGEKARATATTVREGTVTEAAMKGIIKGIGGAVIAAFMVIVVLSQIFQLDIISEGSGPFANLTSDFVTYGTAALGLVGIGIIVGAASFAMNMFGGGMNGR